MNPISASYARIDENNLHPDQYIPEAAELTRSQDDLVFTTEVDTDFQRKKVPAESQFTENVASTRMSDGIS